MSSDTGIQERLIDDESGIGTMSALAIIADELMETIRNAHVALEDCVDGHGGTRSLLHAADLLHQVRGALQSALQSVPYAAGINSHRGSLLTQHPGHMQWLMEAIRERDGLYFVDSYTTHKSVALQIAAELNVAAIRRDVFLDPDRSEATIDREF